MKLFILISLIFSYPVFADTNSETERLLDVALNRTLESSAREAALRTVTDLREENMNTRIWSKIIDLTQDKNTDIRSAASFLKGKLERLYRELRVKQIDLSEESSEDLLLLIKSDGEPSFLRAVAIYKLCERGANPELAAYIQKLLSKEMKWNYDSIDQEFLNNAVHFAKGRLKI